MDYLGHKKLEKDNGIYSSIDGIQEVSGLIWFLVHEIKALEIKDFKGLCWLTKVNPRFYRGQKNSFQRGVK